MSRLPALLRALVLLLLGAAVLWPAPWRAGGGAPRVVWIEGALRPGTARFDSLLVGAPPALLARASAAPPSAGELEALAAAASRAPLWVALPAGGVTVEADAPAAPVAERAAAVAFRVRGAPGDTVLVRLADDAGALDSARVRLDAAGRGSGAFRVRPPRPGWREWTITAGRASAAAGAWVDSAAPPRVRVRAGFPGWESKFVVRALEESGVVVELVQPLGRGLVVGDAEGAAPAFPSAVEGAYDAVMVLDGADVGEAERRALAAFAAEGGGVLLAGDALAGAGVFGLGRAGAAGSVEGTRIRWAPPAELGALPADRVRSSTLPLTALAPGAAAAATVDGSALLALRPLGRGRVAALGVTETWRWRMEAGRVAEHRELWRSLADWLASAPRRVTLALDEPLGPAGAPVEVRVFGADGETAPASLSLVRPDGAREALPLSPDPSRPGVLRARFVPRSPGVHALAAGNGPPSAGFRAVAGTDSAVAGVAWARLALLAERSGGRALPADSLRAEVRRLGIAGVEEGLLPGSWRVLLLGLVVLLAGTEWALRRWSGKA